jgi:predicted transcriptional regulator of viral defense system
MTDETVVRPHSGAQTQSRHPDRAIAELAASPHGVVTRRQLAEIGLGRRAVGNRLANGRLHLLHRGVYSAGHAVLTVDGRWMAAVLAAGPAAALSHRSAAALWGIRRGSTGPAELTVPVPRRPRPGLHPHCASLPADEVTCERGIPVTTVARTLLDLAAVVSRRHVNRALHEAEVRRLTDAVSLPDLLQRHPGARGSAAIKAILEDRDFGGSVIRSELEERFLDFLRRARGSRTRCSISSSRCADARSRSTASGVGRADRRARRPRGAPHAARLRARPRAGQAPERRRLAGREDHLAPAPPRAAGGRR